MQTVFMHWLALVYPKAYAVTASFANSGLRSKAEGARQVAMGLKAGMPDLFMAYPTQSYPGLFIELKYGSNNLTDKQKKVLDDLRAMGYRVAVCWTFEQLTDLVKDYLKDAPYVRCRSIAPTHSTTHVSSSWPAQPIC